jgi:hypothetical protein
MALKGEDGQTTLLYSLEAFRRHAAELAPEVEVRVLSPGEALRLSSLL